MRLQIRKLWTDEMAEPDIEFLPPDIRGTWLAAPSRQKLQTVLSQSWRILKKLTRGTVGAGVPLLTGTEKAPNLPW